MTSNVTDPISSHQGVQIVKVDEDDHSFYLDEEALEELLEDERIRDKPMCIVSVAGTFRQGKSFLLDFFLRYLSYMDTNGGRGDGVEEENVENEALAAWLGNPDEPLRGFHWRCGSRRDTTGILMWSKIFVVKTPGGKEVAVALMDTQGAFDSSSTYRDCATIFALSTMLSSVLVYNLKEDIREDALQHLELFTEYGRLALEESGEKPFQKLQFLVRDWRYPFETAYGASGGDKIVAERLQVSDKQHPELQKLRKHIHSCFSHIDGFLLPFPGEQVASDPQFDGKLKDISSLFLKHLSDFVPRLLSPEKIVVKRISGNEVRCKELVQFFRAYVDIFRGDEMPKPMSVMAATSEANNQAALAESKEAYKNAMSAVCGGERPFVNERVLESEHCRARDHAVEVFSSRPKMGGKENAVVFLERLEQEIEEAYTEYRAHNDSKNIFKAANTPISLAALGVLFYVLAQFFSLLRLTPIASVLNLFMMATFILFVTWAYAKYTGNLTDVTEAIDKLAVNLWESGLQPVMNKLAHEGSQYAARMAIERMNSTTSMTSPTSSTSKSKKTQ